MIDEALVKNIFFYVNDKDPNGYYADNVNILDFARKLEAVLEVKHRASERVRCVEFIRQHDVPLAGLLEKMP